MDWIIATIISHGAALGAGYALARVVDTMRLPKGPSRW